MKFFFCQDDTSTVVRVSYAGPPEWLSSQKDPRSHWHQYQHLREIEFEQTSLTKAQMSYISSLQSVTSIIANNDVHSSCDAFAPLEDMLWLEHLDLMARPACEGSRWGFLQGLSNLKSLVLEGDVDNRDFENICRNSKIEFLDIRSVSSICPQTIRALSQLHHLRSLSLGGVNDSLPVLESICKLPCLTRLSLAGGDMKVCEEGVALLSGMRQLSRLSLAGSKLHSVAPLGNLKELTDLSIAFDEIQAPNSGALSGIAGLEILSLGKKVDFNVEHLRFHPSLRILRIGHAVLTIEDVDTIETIINLETLLVANVEHSAVLADIRRRIPKLRVTSSGRFAASGQTGQASLTSPNGPDGER